MIKEEIFLSKSIYALPIYNPEYIKSNNDESLQLMISDTLFLDTLFCKLRGAIIDFSKKLKKKERAEEKVLLDQITTLESETETNSQKIEELLNIKDQLENIRENRIKGSMIRSRAQLSQDWEKPSKYFLNLEKRNYINKSIPSLTIDGCKITDSTEILKQQHRFYSDLYSSKGVKDMSTGNFACYIENMKRLSNKHKENLDKPLTLDELEIVIRGGKLNKAPGPDGFSNEFFKTFLEELKHWIFRYLLESIDNQYFTETLIEGVITCIPKSGKLRNDLKNWRPLTLLNCVYKFFSSMIANRLKPELPFLINEDQTGFISGRFIGENTRTVYDLIEHCESFNKKGLILVLDFAKAFDTIEWHFINNIFKFLNFGETFCNYLKLLQTNSFSRIEQNGYLSDRVSLSRGCRQGDPISPYVFVICAEMLSHILRECEEVKGIVIHDVEMLVSQYADDTTVFLDEDLNSFNYTVRILKWFEGRSGLAINSDKTKVIKLGASRGKSIPWQGKHGFEWTTTFEILGIIYNIEEMQDITKLNIYRKVGEVKKLISTWHSRNLTPYGKITIIKSLLMSKFTHMLLSLPSPSEDLVEELNALFKGFLWAGKPPKYRREILEAEIKDGGLKLHNIKLFDNALKLGWLKRYLRSNSKWTLFPKDFDIDGVFIYGPDYIDRLEAIISNPFWLDVLTALKTLWNSNFISEKTVIMETPIWLNPTFKFHIRREWKEKGISVISDFIDHLRTPYTMESFTEHYGVKTNFLEYARFSVLINEYLSWKDTPETKEPRPKNSFLNIILSKDLKGVSNLYKQIFPKGNQIIGEISTKWQNKTNIEIQNFDFQKSFLLHNRTFTDCFLKYTQFRTLHRRFFTNDKLSKMGIKASDKCTFCKVSTDSVEHMLLYCPIINQLWDMVNQWITEIGFIGYNLSIYKKIIGDLENGPILNSIILITKKVIYDSFKKDKIPSIFQIKSEVKNHYYLEKYTYRNNGKIQLFEKKWHLLTLKYENA